MNPKTPTIKYLNRAETDAFNDLAAGLLCLQSAGERMEERLRGNVPDGWRDLRMITTRLMSLLNLITQTIPENKRKQVVRHANACCVKLTYVPEAHRDPDVHLLLTEDLGVLLKAASDRCKVCMGTKGECDTCKLGHALDHTSFLSRGAPGVGGTWWEIFSETRDD